MEKYLNYASRDLSHSKNFSLQNGLKSWHTVLYYNIYHGFTVSYRALKHLVNGDYSTLIVTCQGLICPKPFGAPRPRCRGRGGLEVWFGFGLDRALLLHYNGNRLDRVDSLGPVRSAVHYSSTLLHYSSTVLHYNINCHICIRVLLHCMHLSVSFASFKIIKKRFSMFSMTYANLLFLLETFRLLFCVCEAILYVQLNN